MKGNKWNYLGFLFIGLAVLAALNKYLISGEHAFGASPAVPWGSLIAGYVFFAAAATGTGLVSSLGHVFRVKKYEILAKRALLASIVLLLCAFGVLAIELSSPFKMIWFLFTPNLSSPIFWMGAFYGVYLILLSIEFYFTLKDKQKAVTPIAYVSLAIKLAALLNLGRVFGYIMSREFWYGYYYPVYMVITAIVSGSAVLIMLVYLFGLKDDKLAEPSKSLIPHLGKILAGAIAVFAAAQATKIGLALASSEQNLVEAAKALISGPVAPSFWLMEVAIGIGLPLFLLISSKFASVRKVVLAAVLAMVGLLFSRLNFVYSGQIYPLEVVPKPCLPFLGYNYYAATWSEWGIILGAIGVIIVVFNIAENKLNLDPSH
jgi:Ni/Fe-hydrogenase subunit HybB-like protein